MVNKADQYLTEYQASVDLAVEKNPFTACGTVDDRSPRHLDYLKANGLKPKHILLDLGCGVLRSGRHMIEYLDMGHYYGVDLSGGAIEYARTVVDGDEGLKKKAPTLYATNGHLKFDWFDNQKFNWIWAGSVFNHLMPEHVQECLENVSKVMLPNSRFFFTFKSNGKWKLPGFQRFKHYKHFMWAHANDNGLGLLEFDDFALPGGNTTVICIERKR